EGAESPRRPTRAGSDSTEQHGTNIAPKGTWAEVVGTERFPNGRDERTRGFSVPGREFKEETCRGTSLSRSLDHAGGRSGIWPGLAADVHPGRWPDEQLQHVQHPDRDRRLYPEQFHQPARAARFE